MKKDTVLFEIERLDPLGQGVSKIGDKITFIPKTLPGEKGTAQITGKKKGIQFAQVIERSKSSVQRIEPDCPHFVECSGCDYLHTSYEQELINKKQSFERLLSYSPFSDVEVQCHGAPERHGYRNRIQLHYDVPKKALGFFKGRSNQIHEVPGCKVPQTLIRNELEKLYEADHWLELLPPKSPTSGHVELYEKEGNVLYAWNETYAFGGFTQVNEPMNELALELWKSFYESSARPKNIYDVFGGSGNLTRGFTASKVEIFDSFCQLEQLSAHQSFTKKDLYKESHPPEGPVDFLIFDPPRSGFKEALHWIEELEPPFIGYQSCFADTMIRDLKKLPEHYRGVEAHLLDFFPGTHHYEALIFIKNTRA